MNLEPFLHMYNWHRPLQLNEYTHLANVSRFF